MELETTSLQEVRNGGIDCEFAQKLLAGAPACVFVFARVVACVRCSSVAYWHLTFFVSLFSDLVQNFYASPFL